MVASENSVHKLLELLPGKVLNGEKVDVRPATRQNLSQFEAQARKRECVRVPRGGTWRPSVWRGEVVGLLLWCGGFGARVLAVGYGLVAQLVRGPKNEMCVKRTVLGVRFRLSVLPLTLFLLAFWTIQFTSWDLFPIWTKKRLKFLSLVNSVFFHKWTHHEWACFLSCGSQKADTLKCN